jgi:ABC-type phosphate transport system substrate-binding protein
VPGERARAGASGGVGKSGEGNEGTAATVKNTEGAITYNEWSFAQAQNLFTAKIIDPGRQAPVASAPVGSDFCRRAGARAGGHRLCDRLQTFESR